MSVFVKVDAYTKNGLQKGITKEEMMEAVAKLGLRLKLGPL